MTELYIFIGTIVISLPLVGVLLYVWHKFGRGDRGVTLARYIFLTGVFLLLGYMIVL
jgi:hypothetical protein